MLSDDEVVDRLTSLRGIGRWTAEWILVRLLGRPRVVAGDLGVRKAVGMAYPAGPLPLEMGGRDEHPSGHSPRGTRRYVNNRPSEAEGRAATVHRGAAAAIAQRLLLRGLVEGVL